MDKIPTKNADKKAMIRGRIPISFILTDEVENSISYIIEAIIIGMLIRKENFALSFLFSPSMRAVQIVEPERDIPGITAIP